MSRKDWNRPSVEMPEGKRRIKLTISYDGSCYHGWQRQDGDVSVQAVIEDELKSLLKEDIVLSGSGRTDSGVHALGQVAHFDTTSTLSPEKYRIILNTRLPKSIRILSSEEPGGVFHARFTATAREYWYFIKAFSDMFPFDEKRMTGVKMLPNLVLLNAYAKTIEGTHDFTTFCSSKDMCPSKWRDIYTSVWSEERDSYGRPFLKYMVVGNAFLYHQVRSMVGTMVEAALNGESVDSFRERLESRKRENALKTYPPEGLYLARISYDEDEYRWFEEIGDGRESN